MKLTSDVLVWLAAVVRQDKDDEEEHVHEELDDTQPLPKFISYDHKRDAYKVRCKGAQKFFPKSEKCDDPLGEAIAFVQHIQSSKA